MMSTRYDPPNFEILIARSPASLLQNPDKRGLHVSMAIVSVTSARSTGPPFLRGRRRRGIVSSVPFKRATFKF